MMYDKKFGDSGYRRDIDGLRAIAVLSIVIFHIEKALLPGGFVGVDIFFVISGYLISGIIIRRSLAGDFSYIDFYRNRILRIMPALTLVIVSCLIAGKFILLSEDFESLGHSALASQLSLGNVYFTYFLDTSYFSRDSELQPLLHLWSLGVEEQFYLFWPPLLIVLLSIKGRIPLFFFLATLIAMSVAFAEYYYSANPSFVYYMLPARAGELLLGAATYCLLSWSNVRLTEAAKISLSVFGAILIFYSFFFISEEDVFPGLNSLPATIGAAMLIGAGSQGRTVFSRLLGAPILLFFGVISYSLYLWHWPVLAFYRYLFGTIGLIDGVVLFSVMVLLAYGSYRFVEAPFRFKKVKFSTAFKRFVLTPSLLTSAVAVAVLVGKGGADGMEAESGPKVALPAYKYDYVCQKSNVGPELLREQRCTINSDGEPSVLLWGDSHAAHYVGVVAAIAGEANFGFRNVAHSSCPPLLYDLEKSISPKKAEECLNSNQEVRKVLDKYTTIILGAAWPNGPARNAEFATAVERTVQELVGRGKEVIILGDVPRLDSYDNECTLKAQKLALDCESMARSPDKGDFEINSVLKSFAETHKKVSYFDVRKYICDSGYCNGYLDGRAIYFDTTHLSMDGSWQLGHLVVADQGVPAAFSKLRDKGGAGIDATQIRSHLVHKVKNKFSVLDERGITLALEELLQDSRSSAQVTVHKSASGIAKLELQDESDREFESFTFRVDLRKHIPEINTSVDSRIMISIDLEGEAEVVPMVRVTEKGQSEILMYESVVDLASLKAKSKRLLKKDQTYLADTDGVARVYLEIPITDVSKDLEVRVYPAVGLKFPLYSVKSVGKISLSKVSIYFPRHTESTDAV